MSFFDKYFVEEGEDAPPADTGGGDSGGAPPPEAPPADDGPPEMPTDLGGGGDMGGGTDDMPPGMDDFGGDDSSGDTSSGGGGEDDGNKKEPTFAEKISNILNSKLYQRFISLLNRIENQLLSIKNNFDIFNIICSESTDHIDILKKLSENIRLYINEYFINESYSKNLLFFNKCLNLYKLTNDELIKVVKHGIK